MLPISNEKVVNEGNVEEIQNHLNRKIILCQQIAEQLCCNVQLPTKFNESNEDRINYDCEMEKNVEQLSGLAKMENDEMVMRLRQLRKLTRQLRQEERKHRQEERKQRQEKRKQRQEDRKQRKEERRQRKEDRQQRQEERQQRQEEWQQQHIEYKQLQKEQKKLQEEQQYNNL